MNYIPGSLLRASAERAAAIADGERRRDPALQELTDAELLSRLRAEITRVVEATRLARVEAAKLSPCHALLEELCLR